MVYRFKDDSVQNHLTVGLPKPLTYKPIALYALYKRDTNTKRWIRVSENAYSEKLACRVFGERLAEAPLTYSIRPVKVTSEQAQGKSRFRQPTYKAGKEMIQSSAQELLNPVK